MKRVRLTPDEIRSVVDSVSDVTGISRRKMFSKDRHAKIVASRFMVYYILYRHYGLAYYRIGQTFKVNHAGVMYGVAVVEDWLKPTKFKDKSVLDNSKLVKQILKNLTDTDLKQ